MRPLFEAEEVKLEFRFALGSHGSIIKKLLPDLVALVILETRQMEALRRCYEPRGGHVLANPEVASLLVEGHACRVYGDDNAARPRWINEGLGSAGRKNAGYGKTKRHSTDGQRNRFFIRIGFPPWVK